MNIRLKILYIFVVISFFISSMVIVLLFEHRKISEIEQETKDLRGIRTKINYVHRSITELATLGETVISWTDKNYEEYHLLRMKTDMCLEELRLQCNNIVQVEQIDSLRSILYSKELHLRSIMEFLFQQENVDSILVNRLLVSTKHQPNVRTITRKKKGLAGWLGRTEKINIITSDTNLEKQNNKLVKNFYAQKEHIESYVDSLRIRNIELNKRLRIIVKILDEQAQKSFYSKEERIIAAQIYSLQLFSVVLILSIILLFVSFFIICRYIKKEDRSKLNFKEIIKENEDLLEMRKKVILTVSHDIRGPLGNIHNCADLAFETSDKKKREAYLQDIRHSCNHVLHLVNDLMDAYRINEAGDLRNDVPFHLGRFLQRISDEFSRKANKRALIFYYTHIDSDLTVKGDADKIERVLANLLTNAIKFTPSGSIHFQSEYSCGELHVEVMDTGIGMARKPKKGFLFRLNVPLKI